MKKTIILLIALLPLIYLSSCTEDPVKPEDKDLLQIVSFKDSVTAVSGLMESGATIKNISDKNVTVQLKLEIVSLMPGHKALVCIGDNCYAGVTSDKLYPGTFTLAPGEETKKTHFFAELNADGVVGESKIRYKFIPNGDTTKAVSYITVYKLINGL